MAAYGAVVSLMHIIEKIQHHPLPPISLDQKQVESLIDNVTFMQDFLEGYSHGSIKEAGGFESRIADAAYAAEDIIESRILEIHGGSTSHGEKIGSIDFYQVLQKVIEDMELIKKEVMEIIVKTGIQDQLHRNSTPDGSPRSSSLVQSIIVGLDDVSNEIINKLTGDQSNRLIIPIVGMGGIGKTTLARNIYVNPLIMPHFDILAWVTISHEYSVQEIFSEVLLCLNNREISSENLSKMTEDQLGEKLHKTLSFRRYFIVMDDVWSSEVWDKVQLFLPDNNNGSRIMITTRLSKVASELTKSDALKMNFLDENKSWDLFCKNVFGEEDCPPELKEIGMEIAENCKGLPLSIVVIGGLLAKSKQTREYWEYIAENLSSVVNLEDNERCLKILHTSYNQLPVHLKPCFLYMGIYPQNHVIRVSRLIKLWVAEGFLKPISGKSLEVVAEAYLHDLTDRNLIIVRKLASDGKLKFCKIHDLLRDLCLREAQKEKFIYVARQHGLNTPQRINTQHCIGIHHSTLKEEYLPQFVSLYRPMVLSATGAPPSAHMALLRILRAVDKHSYSKGEKRYKHSLEAIFQLVNLRYLAIRPDLQINSIFPSSVYLLWNLQTLIVKTSNVTAPSEIWKMPQLRHVMFGVLDLPDPPSGHINGRDDIVLENLQTLLRINNFKCGEEVVKRIPNIKKLKVYYEAFEGRSLNYCLNNIGCLHQLESLSCSFTSGDIRNYLLQNLTFPYSLRKLTLEASFLHWEDMTTMIGSLPLLQVLKLRFCAFIGPEWETVEGQFCSLKFLLIDTCSDFESWITDSSHFPCLEHLVLRDLEKFKEIPLGIGDIPTLQSIELDRCSDSAVISAKEILEEQEGLENEGLQVRVKLWKRNEVLESLGSRNFQVSR